MNGNNSLARKYQRRERKLRAAYRRRIVIAFILALAIGAVGGWFANERYGSNNDTSVLPTVTSEPTAEPTEQVEWSDPVESEATDEPTVEPTTEPTTEPTVEATAEPTDEPTAEPTDEPTVEPTEEPTAEPTEEPTEEPTAEPTEEPAAEPQVGTAELPVPVEEAYTFNFEVLFDGTPRKSVDDSEYFVVPVTLTLTRHIGPEYYAATYGSAYMLKGNEAGCELNVTLGDSEGLNEVVLQNALEVVLQNAAGEVQPGYQFTNAEISGQTDSLIATGTSATIYKRYNAGEVADLEYLTVSYYEGGEKKTAYFALGEAEAAPTPEPTAEPTPEVTAEPEATEETTETAATSDESYTVGSTGEAVSQLQRKLIELGYLSGKPDGQFGQWTAAAVKEAQKDLGLEQTGIADAAFLDLLYTK